MAFNFQKKFSVQYLSKKHIYFSYSRLKKSLSKIDQPSSHMNSLFHTI